MDNETLEKSVAEIIKAKISVDRYDGRPYGYEIAARRIVDEIILPIKLDLIEARAKNEIYEAAITNSNFAAIIVRKKPIGSKVENGKDNRAQ